MISPFCGGLNFRKLCTWEVFREIKTLAKISEFTVYIPRSRVCAFIELNHAAKLIFYFFTKTDDVCTQKNHLNEMVLLSTQKICLDLWLLRNYFNCMLKIFLNTLNYIYGSAVTQW